MHLQTSTIIARTTHGTALQADIEAVICSTRDTALAGLRLKSDRQPQVISVENIFSTASRPAPQVVPTSGRNPQLAKIWVTIDANHWARLAYQFGHELGHVLSNSWGTCSQPFTPCVWIEEACVEAFSLRALFLMAESWKGGAPYPHWADYGPHFESYAIDILRAHRQLAEDGRFANALSQISLAQHRELESDLGLRDCVKPLASELVDLFRKRAHLVDDLGALNRWPERSGLPLAEYLNRWQQSCVELDCSGDLPRLIKNSLSHLLPGVSGVDHTEGTLDFRS